MGLGDAFKDKAQELIGQAEEQLKAKAQEIEGEIKNKLGAEVDSLTQQAGDKLSGIVDEHKTKIQQALENQGQGLADKLSNLTGGKQS